MDVRKKGLNKRRNLNCLEGLYLQNSISRIKDFGLAFYYTNFLELNCTSMFLFWVVTQSARFGKTATIRNKTFLKNVMFASNGWKSAISYSEFVLVLWMLPVCAKLRRRPRLLKGVSSFISNISATNLPRLRQGDWLYLKKDDRR